MKKVASGYFWLKNALYYIMNVLGDILELSQRHPIRERKALALQETVAYINARLPDALGFYTKQQLLDYALSHVGTDGHYLEFGVYRGGSLTYIAKKRPALIIHGFDSFEGLPQNWSGFNLSKGSFSTGKRLPNVPSNTKLHVGLFEDTLPGWVEAHPGPVAFMNIDCDIYSSTVTILHHLAPRLVPGTIIFFDEYFNYPNWRAHEYRAWQECVAAHNIRYEYIAYGRYETIVRIL